MRPNWKILALAAAVIAIVAVLAIDYPNWLRASQGEAIDACQEFVDRELDTHAPFDRITSDKTGFAAWTVRGTAGARVFTCHVEAVDGGGTYEGEVTFAD